MDRFLILSLVVVFIFGILLGLFSSNLTVTGKATDRTNVSVECSYTKALCYESQCMDVLVKCSGGKAISVEPVSKAVEFEKNWTDLRNQTEGLC